MCNSQGYCKGGGESDALSPQPSVLIADIFFKAQTKARYTADAERPHVLQYVIAHMFNLDLDCDRGILLYLLNIGIARENKFTMVQSTLLFWFLPVFFAA